MAVLAQSNFEPNPIKVKAKAEAPPLFMGEFSAGKTLQIICVDDFYLNLEALKIVFESLGLIKHCEFYTDGERAVERATRSAVESIGRTDLFQIVITDYAMPGMTGIDVIQQITQFYKELRED